LIFKIEILRKIGISREPEDEILWRRPGPNPSSADVKTRGGRLCLEFAIVKDTYFETWVIYSHLFYLLDTYFFHGFYYLTGKDPRGQAIDSRKETV
jgi:hypothetical protein